MDLDYAITTTTTTTQLFLSLPASLIIRCNTVSRHPAASSVSACSWWGRKGGQYTLNKRDQIRGELLLAGGCFGERRVTVVV